MSQFLRPYVALLSLIGAFAVNTWSNIDPINGESIGQISNTTFAGVLITPANYAFIIWGVIYLGLLAFAIYQLLPAQSRRTVLDPARTALIVSSVAQGVWVVLFLLRFFWGSLVAMVVILGALIWGYHQQHQTQSSRRDRQFVDQPLSLYLGWISVATIVNGAIALYSQGWEQLGLGAPVWTVIMLIIAVVLGCVMVALHQDVVFAGVVIWALVAIAVKQSGTPLILGTTIVGSVVLLGAIAQTRWQLLRNDKN